MHIIIVSGFSGAGKTTIINESIKKIPENAARVISSTTRNPRLGEIDGVDYHFLSKTDARKILSSGTFVEHNEVYGNTYGIQENSVNKILHEEKIPIICIDVLGALYIEKYFKNKNIPTTSVFVSVKNKDVLIERIKARGSSNNLKERLEKYDYEQSFKRKFDIEICNINLSDSINEFCKIIKDVSLKNRKL